MRLLRSARASAVSMRSLSSRRLGRSVRLSCSAACSRIFSVLRRLGRVVEAHQPRAVAGLRQVDRRRDGPDLATERMGEPLLGLAVGEKRRPFGERQGRQQCCPGDRAGRSAEQSAQGGVGRRDQAGGVDEGGRDRVAIEDRTATACGRHAGAGRPGRVAPGRRPPRRASAPPPPVTRLPGARMCASPSVFRHAA